MTGLEKIKERIISDAQKEAEAVMSDSEVKAELLKEQIRREAGIKAEEILRDAEKRAEQITSQSQSEAEQISKNDLLLIKRKTVEETISEAEKKLTELEDEKYFKFIKKLIIKNALTGAGKLRLSELDKNRLPSGFVDDVNNALMDGKTIELSEDYIDHEGGFIAIYGDIEINCTFPAIIKSEYEKLEDIAASALFEK